MTSSQQPHLLSVYTSSGMSQLAIYSNDSYIDDMDQDKRNESPKLSLNARRPGIGHTLHTWLDDRDDELVVSIDQGGTGFVGRSHESKLNFRSSTSL